MAASLLSRVLPKALGRRVDQARLDARVVLDQLGGTRAPSVTRRGEGPLPPTPLEDIDPVDHLLPRGAAERVQGLRRDVRVLANGLRGVRPSPLVARPANARTAAPPPSSPAPVVTLGRGRGVTTRPVTVTRVVRETPDAVSLYLAEADGAPLRFVPGQFMTLEVTVAGERLRRAYSLASAALDGHEPHVTVKRVQGGRASNHLNDHAAPGDVLDVLGPSGAFTCAPDPTARRLLVLVAGGSGITPIASIVATLLAAEPGTRLVLVYGNRRAEDVIFRERLDALASAHPGRLVLDHVLSEPPAGWAGATGLLDGATLAARLAALGVTPTDADGFYVCGPTPMMDAARATLGAAGVDPSRIHEERFSSPELRARPDTIREPRELTITRRGAHRTVVARPGQTLLEAGLAAGIDMPFSCAMGGCGACRVKLTDGDVVSEEPSCLSATERERGYVLACVSRATTPVHIEIEG